MEVWHPIKKGFSLTRTLDHLWTPLRPILGRSCMVSPRCRLMLLSLKYDCRRLEKRLELSNR